MVPRPADADTGLLALTASAESGAQRDDFEPDGCPEEEAQGAGRDKGDDIDAALVAVRDAMALKKAGYKPASTGKAKAKAKAKGKGKAKAKAKGGPKAAAAPAAPKAKAKIDKKLRPACQPLKKMPVLRYCGCSIYSSEVNQKWRAVSDSNRRYDKGVSWSKGKAGWTELMEWCENNGMFEE